MFMCAQGFRHFITYSTDQVFSFFKIHYVLGSTFNDSKPCAKGFSTSLEAGR